MIRIPEVTLCCVTNDWDVENAQKSMQYSMRGIEFGKVILLSVCAPKELDPRIKLVIIPPLGKRSQNSYKAFSDFFVNQLSDFIEANTDDTITHALFVHPDAFVINPHLWQDKWLQYDFIGAPWGNWPNWGEFVNGRVGNGGFSLRSKKIMKVAKFYSSVWRGALPEDGFYCIYCKGKDPSLKIPTVCEAIEFSYEGHYDADDLKNWDINNSFGFHRIYSEAFMKHAGMKIDKSIRISVFTFCWNEAKLIPHFLEHYKFADFITVYDNDSTDNSVELLKADSRVTVIPLHTKDGQHEEVLRNIRNNCWKGCDSDWAIVCDMDEFVYHRNTLPVFLSQVPKEISAFNIPTYEMWADEFPEFKDKPITELIKTGFHFDRSFAYKNDNILYHFMAGNKAIVFRSKITLGMHYVNGSHACTPKFIVGEWVVAPYDLKILHYKYLGREYLTDRINKLHARNSEDNKQKKVNVHWDRTMEQVEEDYDYLTEIKGMVI